MGIDCDSKLIIGWEISYDKLIQYLIDTKAGSCHYYGNGYNTQFPCNCGTMCWSRQTLMDEDSTFSVPEGVHIRCSRPYYACQPEDCRYFISLTDKNYIDSTTLKNLLNDHELIKRALEFKSKFDDNDNELQVLSTVDIM